MKKKTFVSIGVILAILTGVTVGGISYYNQEVDAQTEKKELIAKEKLVAEQERESQQSNAEAAGAVAKLFVDRNKKSFLADDASIARVEELTSTVDDLKDKDTSALLLKDLGVAKELLNEVSNSNNQVQSLFADNSKKKLANNVSKEKIEMMKKLVDKNMPQKSAQKKALQNIALADGLLSQQIVAQNKEVEPTKVEQGNNSGTSEKKLEPNSNKNSEGKNNQDAIRNGSVKKDNSAVKSENNTDQNNNYTQNDKKTESPKQSTPSVKSSESSSPTTKPATNNQPIVAQMNLASKTSQIITVVASGSSATVKFWEKNNGTWSQVFATSGLVGSQGVGSADEYHSRTPRGAYSLGFAFGTSNPGTSLSFRQITNRSYWISNVKDSQYNTWQERNSSSSADEKMANYPVPYKYGVVINYNTSRVAGAGSGFFLHCSNGAPTAGCVSIPTSYMKTVLQNLHGGAYIVNVTSEQELLNY